MKSKFADTYSYDITYNYDESCGKYTNTIGSLYSYRNNRKYKTKLNINDLPEYYCDVTRYCGFHELIKSINIKDLKYSWVKENHFMKDSVLRISFTDKITCKPFKNSCFMDYENVNALVFGYDILKFIAYVNKYSDYDISEIKSEFIKHCEWLKENEPFFAPDCNDFSKWFDEKINDNKLWRH